MPFAIALGNIRKISADVIVVPNLKRPVVDSEKNIPVTRQFFKPYKYIMQPSACINDSNEVYSIYTNALLCAKRYNFSSIAFPLILADFSEQAQETSLGMATSAISNFLNQNDMHITLVVTDSKEKFYGSKIQKVASGYIDEFLKNHQNVFNDDKLYTTVIDFREDEFYNDDERFESSPAYAKGPSNDKKFVISDYTFSQALLKLIEKKGLTDVEAYRRANVDRKLFSKIRSDKNYRPKKQTIIAFAIALELNIKETNALLYKAGYSLSDSILFDIIIKYFIENQTYDIYLINEVLFAYDQSLLGC